MKYLGIAPGGMLRLPAHGALRETVHVFGQESIDAVNAALAAGRPLLVRGEPGTGKSQLARAAAAGLGRVLVSSVIDARSEARDLLWTFDAVARLAEAQVQAAIRQRDETELRENLRQERFLTPGPLWWTFDWKSAEKQTVTIGSRTPPTPEGWKPNQGAVLLIDEIDKADSSVPNGLLEALGEGRFTCPGGAAVTAEFLVPPLVIVTTNEERALPDPFLRRCLVLQLRWPEDRDALVAALVQLGQAHFKHLSGRILVDTAKMLANDRERIAGRGLFPPGGAEYLDLLRALYELAPDDEGRQLDVLKRIAHFALEKHPVEPPW